MKPLEEKTNQILKRQRDLMKYDLIKMVMEKYESGKLGDYPEKNVVILINGLVTDNFAKVRRGMCSLKVEQIFTKMGMDYSKLERFEGGVKKNKFLDGI